MVLSAVGRVRRNIWSEAQALQCPQRARMALYAAQGPPAQPPAPSPRRATITSEATTGWISVRDSSGGRRLLGPTEWLDPAPDAVHDPRELPGKRDTRRTSTCSLGNCLCPLFQAAGPLDPRHQHHRCLVHQCAGKRVTAFRYSATAVHLARLILLRRQPQVRADGS